jgi:hypothetical protein
MLRALGTCFHNRWQMSIVDKPQFDPQVSYLLHLFNAWPIELWDVCDHMWLKNNNEKHLWSDQPNGKMSLLIAYLFKGGSKHIWNNWW